MSTFAGAQVTPSQIKATVKLLDYYRRFLRSNCERCHNPEQLHGFSMSKGEVRRRLGFLVNAAINRKAGIPDVACRKQKSDYQWSLYRDCRKVRDRINHRVSVRQFETKEISRRYSHLLSLEDE